MKRYVRANTEKPELKDIQTEWVELEDGSGITYTIYSEDKVIFEELFDYQDVDPDVIYDSAVDMAIAALSQSYDLTDEAIKAIKGDT